MLAGCAQHGAPEVVADEGPASVEQLVEQLEQRLLGSVWVTASQKTAKVANEQRITHARVKKRLNNNIPSSTYIA